MQVTFKAQRVHARVGYYERTYPYPEIAHGSPNYLSSDCRCRSR